MAEKEIVGKIFPNITAYSLTKTEVRLPEVAKGKVALITIAFVREAQEMIDSWSIPFGNRFGKYSNMHIMKFLCLMVYGDYSVVLSTGE